MRARALLSRWIELPWLSRERIAFCLPLFLAMYLVGKGIWTARAIAHGMMDPAGLPIGTDFVEFWAAAKAALGHSPALVYDYARFYPLEQTAVPGIRAEYPWHYPPILLLALLPFGLLPYLWALLLWLAGGLAAYLLLLRRIAAERTALWIGLAFPGAVFTLTYGQNGFFLAALLGWGLLLLEERPVLAGMLLGLLAVKPQLVPLLPLVLLATGRWTVLLAAAATLLLLIAASWLLFGSELWLAYFRDVGGLPSSYENLLLPWNRVPTAFVGLRLAGAGIPLAYLLQAATALAAAACAIWAWRGSASPELKAAALVAANFLVSPYLFDYDMVLLILPIAWFGWHAVGHGWLPGEKLALVIVWLSPALISPVAVTWHLQLGALPIAGFLCILCRRIAYERHADRRRAVAHTAFA